MDFVSNQSDALSAAIEAAESEINHSTSDRTVDHPARGLRTVAIIDRRALGRETLTQALAATDARFRIRAFADIGEWEGSPDRSATSVILMEGGAGHHDSQSSEEELRALVGAHPDIPVVMMGESEDSRHIAEILAQGARGYIPTSVSLSVAVGALCLAMAGGTFVPASALLNSSHERPEREQTVHSLLGLSERQAAVADAVAMGKPNKIIAYELKLCESTVKVHIRTIMKKLQARNRTEVAFKLHAAKTRAA
ncbi:LuxR C-terminal-related transcriptional regulator [Inquilinus sp. YAF38]|uniref:LuxR C-terminal-related transcriptional regulator n=1 Tax=Inquilinus sp. YAF38 TaxID=3233084 RepID=UPI003F8D9D35